MVFCTTQLIFKQCRTMHVQTCREVNKCRETNQSGLMPRWVQDNKVSHHAIRQQQRCSHVSRLCCQFFSMFSFFCLIKMSNGFLTTMLQTKRKILFPKIITYFYTRFTQQLLYMSTELAPDVHYTKHLALKK